MRTLNLGIVAHVDAGKTSLTERLLHAAGAIAEPGSVDAGTTRTDSLDLERRRGITIKSAVAAFTVDDVTVNLIDTPGHPDFVAEVERVLGVLDGAVLVVSAVEGVQPQTRVLARTLRRFDVPTILFVNKIDRAGARPAEVVDDLAVALDAPVLLMGSTSGAGSRDASFHPFTAASSTHLERWTESLADLDDAVFAAVVDGVPPGHDALAAVVAERSRRGDAHPVHCGSAMTGAGVDDLLRALPRLLPAEGGDVRAPLSGTVFAVSRGRAGERIAYARLRSGELRVRERVPFGDGREAKVTGLDVVEPAGPTRRDVVSAGRIAVVRGLSGVRVGDSVGVDGGTAVRAFAPPGWEAVVEAVDPRDRGAVHAALSELSEQDPLIGLRRDEERDATHVSLYGEVQKEVIQETLATEYGVDVVFRETTTVHVERLVGVGAAVEVIKGDGNPFLATVGLRVEPGSTGTGTAFRYEIELGSLPPAFMTAVDETVHKTLQEGLNGWRVVDAVVTLTRSGYWARQSHAHGTFDKSMSSTAGDFRRLTPLVLMEAVRRAGTEVLEPTHRFRLELPSATLTAVLPMLSRLRAVPLEQYATRGSLVVEGDVPAASVHALERRLPSLTGGEGALETVFDRYTPITGEPPSRPRTDANPLNRREYLLRTERLVRS